MSKFKFLYCEEGREKIECVEWAVNERIININSNLIIRDEIEGVFKAYETIEDYEKDYPYDGHHLTHEIIFGFKPQKPKFDIENNTTGERCTPNNFNNIKKGITDAFLEIYNINPEFVIYDSTGETKFSKHIVIINRLFKNSREADNFTKNILKKYIPPKDYEFIDTGVNKSTQNFRIAGSVKEGRKKCVDNKHEWYEGLIASDNDYIPTLPELCPCGPCGPCGDKILIHDIINNTNITEEQRKLIRENIGTDFEYNPTRDKNNILVFDRITTGYCSICLREHDRSGIYVCIFDDKILKYCFRNEEKKYEVIWQGEKKFNIMDIVSNGMYDISVYYSNLRKNDIKIGRNSIHKWNDNIWTEIKKDDVITDMSKILNKEIKEKISEEIKKEHTDGKGIEKMGKALNKFTDSRYLSAVFVQCIPQLSDFEFVEKLDSCREHLHFINGYLNLKTGEFQERTKNDSGSQASKCLPYNYSTNSTEDIKNKIIDILKKICNDNEEDYEFMMHWFGYLITGETSAQKFLILFGPKAQNGKSTLMKIFAKSLDIISVKLDKRTFCDNYNKAHKQFVKLKQPTRCAFLEEIDRKRLDSDLIKDIVDGDKIGGNEVLYGTSEDIPLHCKLTLISNQVIRFNTDSGLKRRGLLLELNNLFLEAKKYETYKGKKGVYKIDQELIKNFETNDLYKLSFVQLIIPYAINYYKNGLEYPERIKKAFDELCEENDVMASFIDQYYDITDDDKDFVYKDDFLELYNNHTCSRYKWDFVLSDIKRLLKYDRSLQRNGKRGMILGIKPKLYDNNINNEREI